MKKIERLKRKFNNFMYDHIHVKESLSIFVGVFIAVLTAFLYAFGFYCFVAPASVDHTTLQGSAITTGGVGGVSQVIWMIFTLCGSSIDLFTLQSIFYFVLNIPILIFAFFKIGKKFALITLINVGLSSLFIQLFKPELGFTLMTDIAKLLEDQHVARVLFAGVSIGLASSIAFRAGISCGGIDVISYYFALRKSTSVGKYATALNSVIIFVYSILTITYNKGTSIDLAFVNMLFSFLYLFTVMLVVDFVNIRNKKVQIQIITSFKDISAVLIANFPHSTTTVEGRGGFSHAEKTIVYMVVSSNEVNRVINLAKKVDQHAFITVTSLVQAYGNFFIKPIE